MSSSSRLFCNCLVFSERSVADASCDVVIAIDAKKGNL